MEGDVGACSAHDVCGFVEAFEGGQQVRDLLVGGQSGGCGARGPYNGASVARTALVSALLLGAAVPVR